ncbi:helix-turn-helix transcriptional regulator [Bacillus cereus]|uniref:helix-turn-helix transcriptional regulator n=1 Tax=Bacillus cereus TaxID=1396 RepID=UPI0028535D3C|nr:helix-turn-helix transcriptional regulator [Bacillus cereus]MDR4983547.1 helix-turn-helix transcriptional regulator [Bacillus cereus]
MNSLSQSRKNAGMSQEILAKKVGITRQYLSEIENRKKQPSVIIAVKIAKALNTRVEDIFFEQV